MAREPLTASPLTPVRQRWVSHRSLGVASVDSIGSSLRAIAAYNLQWEGGCSMANSLLDFVMSLVRDPDAAAAYAADPAQAIADANLTDVTSADVNNLIPVVSESLSHGGAVRRAPTPWSTTTAGNVWASGAATAAFDAFDDHVPAIAVDDVHAMADHLDHRTGRRRAAGARRARRRRRAGRGGCRRPVAAVRRPGDRRCAGRRRSCDPSRGDWSHSVPEDHHLDPTTPASTSSTSSTRQPRTTARPADGRACFAI